MTRSNAQKKSDYKYEKFKRFTRGISIHIKYHELLNNIALNNNVSKREIIEKLIDNFINNDSKNIF